MNRLKVSFFILYIYKESLRAQLNRGMVIYLQSHPYPKFFNQPKLTLYLGRMSFNFKKKF